MKLDQFAIVYDNPLSTFYGGQTVTGRVLLKIAEKELKCDGIFLHCTGGASVRWTERHRRKEQTKVRHYTNSESYFDFKVTLLGAGSGSPTVIQPGQYTYPFSIVLPFNLPPSFESHHGHIRYLFTSNIARPWRFDPKTKMPFTVLSVSDLNQLPIVRNPVSTTAVKTVGILCCKSGTITATVSLAKSGFVPGEYILVSAHIDNKTSKTITKTSASLHSITNCFSSGGKRKTVTDQLQQITRGGIEPFAKDEWVNERLLIPAVPPSGLGGCKIITTDYFLKFTVDPAGMFTFDLDITVPLTVGTIPLIDDFSLIRPSMPPWQSQYNPKPSEMQSGQSERPPPYAPPYMQTYPSMPPPSYKESTHGKSSMSEEGDDEHTTGQTEFAPRYAFYQYSQTGPT